MGLLKKYFMHRREGLTCPPVTRRSCTINPFIHKIYANGRGGLTCPPKTRCVCTNKIVWHPIYGNQNQMAQAVAVVQDGTLGRAGIFNYGLFDIR